MDGRKLHQCRLTTSDTVLPPLTTMKEASLNKYYAKLLHSTMSSLRISLSCVASTLHYWFNETLTSNNSRSEPHRLFSYSEAVVL